MTVSCYCKSRPVWDQHVGHVTVRESTEDERTKGFGWNPLTPPDKRTDDTIQRAKKYLVVDYEKPDHVIHVFFMPETAETQEEIVFWAERFGSKNDYGFIRPEGWEGIIGQLPPDDDERPLMGYPVMDEIRAGEVGPEQVLSGERMHAFSGWSTPDGKPPSSGF